jgi:hypothetical protein
VKFNRKKSTVPDIAAAEAAAAAAAVAPVRPRDSAQVDLEGDGVARVDLGGLLLAPVEGLEVRMQVEENTGEVQAVVYAGADGALEVRAFAAQRGGAMWDEVRPQVAADASRKGGTATVVSGTWGDELLCQFTGQMPDGTPARQESRIVGVDGDRWFVRGTLIGLPAIDEAARAPYDAALASLVVRRGTSPMAPGESLPLVVPASARRLDT